jgi:triphosphatase
MSPAREVELKLEVPAHSFYRLARSALLRAARKKSSKPATLVSVYFDTANLKLRNKGLSLRVRRIGRRHVQTIKRENGESAALFARDEWEHPISGRQPDLDVAQDAALGPMFGKKLRRGLKPIFETRVRRTVYPIQSGVSEIELTVDKGKVEAGRQSSPLCEVELELKRGESAELFKLARMLAEEVPIQLAVKSKAERGYMLIAGEAPQAVKAAPTRHALRRSRGIAPNAGRSSAFAGGGLAVCRHAC